MSNPNKIQTPPLDEDYELCKLSQVNELWSEPKHKKSLFYTGPNERTEDE